MLDFGVTIKERYRIKSLLGKGGMSYVYEADDLLLPKKWAIKELNHGNLDESEVTSIRDQFRKEVEILSGLHHPRLPEISDSFTYNGKDYIVIELIPGKTLYSMISEKTEPFSEVLVLDWTLQILDVLTYLHSQNPPVIYRDLKPQNIIIDPQSGVKFIDFGIARLFNPVKEQDTIFMGTPGFAPPEQFRQKQTDFRSDIYSLGATMHYLLTLKDPGANPFDFEPVSIHNPKVSKLTEKVIQKALEIKAENRFQNAVDMKKAITGDITIEDLFNQSFLIIEPREINFDELVLKKVNTRNLIIKSSDASNVKGLITSMHRGLKISPAVFDAPSTSITIEPDAKSFKRGEKEITSIAVSTENNKISIPVSVMFKPTFLRGLSSAYASLIFFLLPIFSSCIWAGNFIDLNYKAEWPDQLFIIAMSIMIGFMLPSRFLNSESILFYPLFFTSLLAFGNSVLPTFSTYQNALFLNMFKSSIFFLFACVFIDTLIICIAYRMTYRQRQDIKLVIFASFFLMPVMLYIFPYTTLIKPSFIMNNKILFFSLLSLISVLYAVAFGYSIKKEGIENSQGLNKNKKSIESLQIYLKITAGIIFAVLWFYLCSQIVWDQSGASYLSGSICDFLKSSGILMIIYKYSVLLPMNFDGNIPCIIILITSASLTLFHIFYPSNKIPAKIFLSLLTFGCLLNLCFGFEQIEKESVLSFRKMITESPEKLYYELLSINKSNFFSEKFVAFYSNLTGGYKMISKRNYKQAINKFSIAEKSLKSISEPSIIELKVRFLADQARFWNIDEDSSKINTEYFDVFIKRIHEKENLFLKPGNEKSNNHSEKTIMTTLAVPSKYFAFLDGNELKGFTAGNDFIAALKYYMGIKNERAGDFDAALKYFNEAYKLSENSHDSPVSLSLHKELSFRKKISYRFPEINNHRKEYLDELINFYKINENLYFALPLMIYKNKNFAASVFEQGDLLETLYKFNAMETADDIKNSLMKDYVFNSAQYRYIKGISELAHGQNIDAYYTLSSLEKDEAFENKIDLLKKMKEISFNMRMWDKVVEYSEAISRINPLFLTSLDHLKWAFANDISGNYEKALPLYEKFLEKKGDENNIHSILARNRINGGALPTLIILEQISYYDPHKYRVVVFGEGIPPECLPELVYYYGKDENPQITISDNIRLKKLRSFTNRNYKKTYNKVEFINPEKEAKQKNFRFYCYYNFKDADFFPIEFAKYDENIFNSKYVKDMHIHYRLPQEYKNKGIHLVKADNHLLAVIPMSVFSGASGKLENLVDIFHNTSSDKYFEEIFPQSMFGVFSKEELQTKFYP